MGLKYVYLNEKVWLWNEFLGRKDSGDVDTGIDLETLTMERDYRAIQCKFYQEEVRKNQNPPLTRLNNNELQVDSG